MNENLNLVEILKDCPKGTELYSTLFGDVKFKRACKNEKELFPIEVKRSDGTIATFMKNGRFYFGYSGECTLFPSRDQRDWSKFTAPWLKKGRFDPKSLQPFDKVLARDSDKCRWACAFYSHTREDEDYKYKTLHWRYKYCIPYNDDTKHLIDTKDEAPDYYRYWED